jgi:long-chain fatty acid transport protein
MADVAWTNWSVFDRLYAVDSTGAPVVDQPEDWEDSWRYSLGLEYSPGSAWTWRAGVAFDETPIPNAELRTPRIPGEDRTWLSFGFSYEASDNMSIDFAYAHLFVDDARINKLSDKQHG